jgi:hypothetical protein
MVNGGCAECTISVAAVFVMLNEGCAECSISVAVFVMLNGGFAE